MNPCIKTGANIWMESTEEAWHGDLYIVAGSYVLRTMPAHVLPDLTPEDCHAVFLDSQAYTNSALHPDCMTHILNLESAGVIIIHQDAVLLHKDFRETLAQYIEGE